MECKTLPCLIETQVDFIDIATKRSNAIECMRSAHLTINRTTPHYSINEVIREPVETNRTEPITSTVPPN